MEAVAIAPADKPVVITAPESKTEAPAKDPFWDAIKPGADKAPVVKPAEKPEAAKASPATTEEVDDFPADIKSEQHKKDWNTLKSERNAAKKALAEFEAKYTTETGELKAKHSDLEKQFTELKAKADPEAFERLKAEREDLSLRLRVKDMTSDPQWERTFVAPVQSAIKDALTQVPAELQRKAEWMLKQPDSEERTTALEEMISGLGTLKASRFANALSVIDSTRAKADSILAEAPKWVEKYEAGQKLQRETGENQSKLAKNQAFDAVTPKFTALPWSDSAEEAPKVAQEAFNTARTYYGSSDPDVQARVAHWAVFGEKALPRIQSLTAELAKANDVIKQLQGSKPGNGSVNPGSKNTVTEKDPFGKWASGKSD